MKPGQFVFYICMEIIFPRELDRDNVCNLPGVGFFRIKDSPYRLMLSKS